jgi:hypothetical protein
MVNFQTTANAFAPGGEVSRHEVTAMLEAARAAGDVRQVRLCEDAAYYCDLEAVRAVVMTLSLDARP